MLLYVFYAALMRDTMDRWFGPPPTPQEEMNSQLISEYKASCHKGHRGGRDVVAGRGDNGEAALS